MKVRLLFGALIITLSMPLLACSPPPQTSAPEAEAAAEVDCTLAETHPIAQGIAEKYNVPYEQVVDWACSGESFDDILLALQTSKLTQQSVDALLAMRRAAGSWEEVWQELGLF